MKISERFFQINFAGKIASQLIPNSIMAHKDLVTQGYVGEFRFNSLLTNSRLQQVGFDSLQLVEAAEKLDAGIKRLYQASPYLRSEYGTAARPREGKNRIRLEWQHIPAEAILDQCLWLRCSHRFSRVNHRY